MIWSIKTRYYRSNGVCNFVKSYNIDGNLKCKHDVLLPKSETVLVISSPTTIYN